MANPIRRVSHGVEAAVGNIAAREDRSFIAQLDRVVAAGLKALGEPIPDDLKASLPPAKRGPRVKA